MCLMDCIKKHFWRALAIFFILTTIGLSVGWGITSEPVSFTIHQNTNFIGYSILPPRQNANSLVLADF